MCFFFFFNDTATTEIYTSIDTLSLHDALPISASAADAHRLNDRRMIAPALLAYAHYLEDAMRLDEALDVLWTLVQVGGPQLSSPDAVAVRLRLARVKRKLNRFDEAEVAYTEAGELATV